MVDRPILPSGPDQAQADFRHVAVVGMACRFPGARDLSSFWQMLHDGRDGLTHLTDEELERRRVPRRVRQHPRFVPVGGLIDGQADFDPEPFGFTDAEAALLDPQHRLFLECAWQALEQAGHGGGRGAGTVGVFAGSMHSSYLASNLIGRWDPTGGGLDPLGSLQAAISTQADYLPLQVAYRLNLTGPAIAVATSCSTSLVAIHLATQSLLSGECDAALAGGVSLIVPQGHGYIHVPGGVFSVDGAVRPFCEKGTGIVYSQGAGVVMLRRLADALGDGDPVLAVIAGSAVNNDGASKIGFTAPSLGGQARVVAEALAVAEVSPRQVGLIEAHGTATPIGDPIEVMALRRVFEGEGPGWCGIGSVKSNIGHANSAAGVASFIKAVLALHHRALPASLHASPLNPSLGLDRSPFEVIQETRSWDTPPYAGVSSFGIGGTNCHVVLGPAPEPARPCRDERPQLLVTSAANPEVARSMAATIAAEVSSKPGEEADIAHTLARGRVELRHRVAGVGPRGLAMGAPIEALDPAPRVVYAFPGAGSARPGLGAGLYRDEPVFAAWFDECADQLRQPLGADVRDVLDPSIEPRRLRDPSFGLPATFALSLATARLLESWGVRPDVILGHSLGECTGAVVAGALSLPEATRLVAARCLAAAEAGRGGAMLALPLDESEVSARLIDHEDLDLAAVNAPRECVVSGPAAAIDSLAARLRADGVAAVRLPVDAAMHSRLMDAALPVLRSQLSGLTGSAPRVPLISSATGRQVGAELGQVEHWADQLRRPVRFSDALRTAVGSDTALTGPSVLVQVGPGGALAGLARRHSLGGLRCTLLTLSGDDPESLEARHALGQLWAHGVSVDLDALAAPGRRRVAAPGYAFQRRRLWIDPPMPSEAGTVDGDVDGHEPLQLPVWRQEPPADPVRAPAGRWLVTGSGCLAEGLRDRLSADGAEVMAQDALAAEQDAGDAGNVTRSLDGVIAVVNAPEVGGASPADSVVASVIEFSTLASTVARIPRSPALALLLVTRGGDQVAGDAGPCPAAAAVRALPRVMAQEQPGLRWASFDLGAPPREPAGEIDAIVAELVVLVDAGPGLTGAERALRSGTRWRRHITPWRPGGDSSAHDEGEPRPQGLDGSGRPGPVLITGGLGAVGQALARHFGRLGHRVVVTSRSVGPRTDHLPEGDVEIRRCDAADEDQTTALVRELSAGEPIRVIVHAAGAVANARLDPLRRIATEPAAVDQVAEHMQSKLAGALALRSAIEGLPAERRPRTVLLMSSVATSLGGVGMGAYAAANAAMDSIAKGAPAGPTRWSSVAWDGWRVALGGSDETVAMTGALDAPTGTRALDRLLSASAAGTLPTAVAVAATDLRDRVAAAARPRCGGGRDESELGPVERAVAELWSELFGTAVTVVDADFFALGGHSLLATRMLGALGDRFGVSLRLRDLLASPTVGGLARLLETAADSIGGPARPTRALPVADDEPDGAGLDDDGTFAMTRVQHAYWVGRDGGYRWGEVPCHFYLEYDCPDLDLGRYEEAWNQVIGRHPMLRSVATSNGRFRVLDDLPRYRIRAHDLIGATEDRRQERLTALRERISRRPGPPDRWPLVQVQAAQLPQGRIRLFIGIDALICDAASWWIVESELEAFYRDPKASPPAVDVHPAQCTAGLARRRAGLDGERAAAYWRRRLGSLPGPPRLPVLEPTGPTGSGPCFVRRSARLSRDEWAAFREAAARHGVTPTAALLTVYTDVLARWSGSAGFSVTLTLFDRPAIHDHVHRVVGDFTALVLHEVPPSPARAFTERAIATQSQMFDDLDHREFSALEFLAEQAGRTDEVRSVPVVFTGTLGMKDMLEDASCLEWVGEQVFAASQTPQTWLDHQVLEQDGELRLQWDSLDGVLPDDQLEAVITEHTARVRALATDTSAWTRAASPLSAASRAGSQDMVLALRADPRRETGGGPPALHLVHPSGGDVLCYADLSTLIDPRVDVFALADPELAGTGGPGPGTVDEIAEQYVAALHQTGGHGPWLLGGWSMGGSVAQEMSRQLNAAGEEVALLLLLDSNDPNHIRSVPGASETEIGLEVMVRYLRALEAFLGVDLDVNIGARKVLAALPEAERAVAVADRLRKHRLLGRGEDVSHRLGVFARHLRALASHSPARLVDPRTSAVLVRADRVSPRNSGIGMGVDDTPTGEDDLGWSAYLEGPLQVVGVEAHHYSLLHPPALAHVGQIVNAALARALSQPFRSHTG